MVQHHFICSSCKKEFRTVSALNQHRIDAGHENFACARCRKIFMTYHALQQHQEAKGHQPKSHPPLRTRTPVTETVIPTPETSFSPAYQKGDAKRWYRRGQTRSRAREKIAYFEQGFQLGQRYLPYAWFGIGCAWFQRKDLDSALNAFQQSLCYAPNAFSTWHRLGIIYARQGKLEDAIDAFEHAQRINPVRDPHIGDTISHLRDTLRAKTPPPEITVPPPTGRLHVIATGGDICPKCKGPMLTKILQNSLENVYVRWCTQCGYKERD